MGQQKWWCVSMLRHREVLVGPICTMLFNGKLGCLVSYSVLDDASWIMGSTTFT